MDLEAMGKALEGIPNDTLTKVMTWIEAQATEERRNTGNIMPAMSIVRLLNIELTQRAIEHEVIGSGTGEPKGFLAAGTGLPEDNEQP